MPRSYYTIPPVRDLVSLHRELNRILDDISRRLNFLHDAGENVSAGGKKISTLAAGSSVEDAARVGQLISADISSLADGTVTPAALTSTDIAAADADAAYSANEVTLINELKADFNLLRADVDALRTAVITNKAQLALVISKLNEVIAALT